MNFEEEEEDSGIFCQMVKCKCGESVLCMIGEYKNGDLIEHSGCKLKDIKDDDIKISLCKNCNCMTKTSPIGKCWKCGGDKK